MRLATLPLVHQSQAPRDAMREAETAAISASLTLMIHATVSTVISRMAEIDTEPAPPQRFDFDAVVPFLTEQASKVWPHARFRFGLRHFPGKKDPFQVFMTEDEGTRTGEVLFIQADAEGGYGPALELLVKRFEERVTGHWAKRSREHMEAERVHRAHMAAVESVTNAVTAFRSPGPETGTPPV